MPYKMEKNKDGSFKVMNSDTGKVRGAHMTKENAEAQMRLMRGVEHGMKPGGTPTKDYTSGKEDKMPSKDKDMPNGMPTREMIKQMEGKSKSKNKSAKSTKSTKGSKK